MSPGRGPRSGLAQQGWDPVSIVLYVSGIHHLEFTPFHKIKGSATEKLVELHAIHDKQLYEPHDSPYCMEDVCNQIP